MVLRYLICWWLGLTLALKIMAQGQDPFYPQSAETNTEISNPNLSQNLPNAPSLYSFKLNHANAKQVLNTIKDLFPNNSISADERTNQIIILNSENTPNNYAQIKQLLKSLDQDLPQIIIEARIVTMNDISLKEIGARWGLFDKSATSHGFNGKLEGNFGNVDNNLNVNLGVINPAGSATIQLATINGRLLDLELSALEKENAINIIATPKLMTTNKRLAKIEQGAEIPYVINGKDDTQDIHFKDALLSLAVTPQLAKNNRILLDLKITQNTAGEKNKLGKNEFIAIEKQEIDTQVLARSGETIVLGGIFHDIVANYEQKVPLLGDIPWIKHLFRKNGEQRQKRELIIFVTPTIIYPNAKPTVKSSLAKTGLSNKGYKLLN